MAIASPGDVTNFKVGNHRVTWNSVVLGITAAGSEITIEKIFRDITGDQYGQTVLDRQLVGEKMSIALTLKEFHATNLSKALPGSTLTSTTTVEDGVQYGGAIKLSSYVQGLVLHPLSLDDTVLTADWNVWKCVPVINGAIPAKHDADLVIPVMFHVLPDTTKAIGKQLFKFGT